MIETPPLLTVTVDYAYDHRTEIRAHLDVGGIVRVFDAKTGEIEYRMKQRPSCLAGLDDDDEWLRQDTRRRWSDAFKERRRRVLAGEVSQTPGAVKHRERNRRAQEAAS